MRKRILPLLLPLILLTSCATDKMANSMWYNATLVNNNGTWGTVVTSMWFDRDSVYTFNGVVVNDSVVVSPYLYAVGVYSCSNAEKNIYDVELEGKTNTGAQYKYSGKMNKKDMVMRLSIPGQSTNETYVYDANVKLNINNKKKQK